MSPGRPKPGTPTRRPEPPPGTLLRFALRKFPARTSPGESPPGHRTFPLCSGEVCRPALHPAKVHQTTGCFLLCSGKVHRAGGFSRRRAGGVPREGVVRSLCVPGGDRAPLTREFPTNSGVGVSAPAHNKKKPPRRTTCKEKSSTQITLNAARELLLFACWNHDADGQFPT